MRCRTAGVFHVHAATASFCRAVLSWCVCRRSPTPPEVRAQRERERELAELERATRTVFAFNINIKADERDIFTFFSKAGEVRWGGSLVGGAVVGGWVGGG